MSSVYRRGAVWWLAFKVPGGRRVLRSSGIPSTEPASEALKMLALVERQLAAEAPEVHTKMTVAEFALTWTATRKGHEQTNAGKDYQRLKLHVLPKIGGRRVSSVRAGDIRTLVSELRRSKLAPRTVINTYGLVRRLFADAVIEFDLPATPCVLKRKDLPKKRDKSPTWRAGAVFTREEAELLLTAPVIPLDRRVTYGLGLCAGCREGEIAALTWESIDRTAEPMPSLLVSQSYTRANKRVKLTKTENPRQVPVHPALERLLGEWQETGFVALFGREPRKDDLLVPNRHGSWRTDNTFVKGLGRDLEALGLRHRRMHDTRRTFVSLGRTDGANPAVLKTITHDQVGDQFDQYTSFTFAAKCEAVSKLRLTGKVVSQARRTLKSGTENESCYTDSYTTEDAMREATETQGETTKKTTWAEGDSKPPLGVSTKRSRAGSRVYEVSRGLAGASTGGKRSNVAASDIEAELTATLAEFRKKGDRDKLAARLRQVLIKVRS